MSEALSSTRIDELLGRIDGSASEREWEAVRGLRSLGASLPSWLLKRYRDAKTWRARTSCVYHAIRYARESDDALTLGLEAIRDRSKAVMYRGAMLLAYSQRKDALPHLREALAAISVTGGRDDLAAAIDAIESANHHLFVDREHTGNKFLTVE